QNIRRSTNPQRLKLLQNTRGKARRRLQIPCPARCGERRFHKDSSPSDGCMVGTQKEAPEFSKGRRNGDAGAYAHHTPDKNTWCGSGGAAAENPLGGK